MTSRGSPSLTGRGLTRYGFDQLRFDQLRSDSSCFDRQALPRTVRPRHPGPPAQTGQTGQLDQFDDRGPGARDDPWPARREAGRRFGRPRFDRLRCSEYLPSWEIDCAYARATLGPLQSPRPRVDPVMPGPSAGRCAERGRPVARVTVLTSCWV